MSANSASSILIKNTGEKFAPDLVKRLHQIRGEKGFANTFTQKPAAVTMDPDLKLSDKAVYDSVSLLAFRAGGLCGEPAEVIAAIAGVSKRTAVPSLVRLRKRGHIRMIRGRERFQAVYRVSFRDPEAQKAPEIAAPKPKTAAVPCPRCQQPCRPRANSGWCRGCVREIDDRRIVAAAYASNPTATEEQIWVAVQIAGKTKRAHAIRKAIRELRREAAA